MENPVILTINDMEIKVQTALGFAGIISGVLLYLTPVPLIIRICRKKSSAEISVAPYLMAYLHCMFSMGYALNVPNSFPITIGGTLGCSILIFYIDLSVLVSPKEVLFKRIQLVFVVAFVLVIGTFVPISMDRRPGQLLAGSINTIFSIGFYSSSLVSVIKKNEEEFMSFYTSILMFLNGAFWFAFGLLGHNFCFALSNGFSCGVGAIQMYLLYPNKKGETMKQKKL